MIQLHDIFSALSLDVSTEFLFGESTGTLRPEGAGPETEEFLRAYNHWQGLIEGVDGKWGILSLYFPDTSLKRDTKIVHCKSSGSCARPFVTS